MIIDNNLYDYLRSSCTLHPNPPFYEEKGFLESLNIYKNLKVVEIFSTNIYPRRVNVDGQNYILWDNNFWELYSRFLKGIIKYTKPTLSFEEITNYFFGLFLLFLSYRFDRSPALSYLFADFGAKTKLLAQHIPSVNQNPSDGLTLFENTFFISKWFVFEHEILHHKYKINQNQKNKDTVFVLNACEFISKASEFNDQIDNMERKTFTSFFDNIKDDSKLIEELCCDVFALTKIIPIYAKIHNISLNIACAECLQSSRYVIYFQSILNQIENHWENAYNFVNKTIINSNKDYLFESLEAKTFKLETELQTQRAQYNLRQNFTFLITLLVYRYCNIDISTVPDINDFFSSDAFKFTFVPMIDNTIIGFDFTNNIFLQLVDIYNHYTLPEYRKKRDQLIGWN